MRTALALAVGIVSAALLALMVHAATFTAPVTGTATSGGGVTAAALTMTNGPPNIPTAGAGSCDTRHCTWIGTGNWPSGTHVSLVFADMSPMSVDYSGSFSISDTTHFSITTNPQTYTYPLDGTTHTRQVGEIKTAQANIPAGDYPLTVTAGGAGGSNSVTTMVHVASGTTVSCGAGLPTSGTVLLSPNCTYNVASISPSGGTTYIGAGNGSTVINGSVGNNWTFPIAGNSNLSFIGITVQGGDGGMDAANPMVIRNSQLINNGSNGGAHAAGNVFIANNIISHNQHNNMHSYGGSGTDTVIGNEMTQANWNMDDICDDAGNWKITGSGAPTISTNNYMHDNFGSGMWSDFYGAAVTASNNTFVRNGAQGTVNEQSRSGWTIDHNVFVHNGDGSTQNALGSACGGEAFPQPGIEIAGGSDTNIHDNNVSVYTVFDSIIGANKTGIVFHFDDELGNGTGFVGNNTTHDNTVNFFTTNSGASWGWNTSSEDTSGSSSNNNHFHLIGGNTSTDAHWYWFNQGNTPQTFANYKTSGQEATSTIDTINTSAPGCTHVACSGSGVGAAGVPQ